MNYTTYYKLQKPLGTEKYDIEVHNANSDVIDAALSYLQDKNKEQSSTLSNVLNKVNTHEADGSVHISDAEREELTDINIKKHIHENKSILDNIASTHITAWNDAAEHISDTAKHITDIERNNWNIAKAHADSTHARTDATNVMASSKNGSIKINGAETSVYVHPIGTNPHGTTKADLGLDEVENKSSAAIRNELTKGNVTNALGYVPYTPNEIDNKFSALETNIDWKESVDTYDQISAIYPAPQDGWTVNVKDTDYTYRYNGTGWVAISANAIPKATREMDGLLSKEDKVKYDDALAEMRNQYATKEELNALSDVVGQANALLESI